MLKYYHWDARNKTLMENIEHTIHNNYSYKIPEDVHVIKIEYIKEPIVTNLEKQYYPDTDKYRYYRIAHISNGDIAAFTPRQDGTYPNIP